MPKSWTLLRRKPDSCFGKHGPLPFALLAGRQNTCFTERRGDRTSATCVHLARRPDPPCTRKAAATVGFHLLDVLLWSLLHGCIRNTLLASLCSLGPHLPAEKPFSLLKRLAWHKSLYLPPIHASVRHQGHFRGRIRYLQRARGRIRYLQRALQLVRLRDTSGASKRGEAINKTIVIQSSIHT